jgi:hypothetical protein
MRFRIENKKLITLDQRQLVYLTVNDLEIIKLEQQAKGIIDASYCCRHTIGSIHTFLKMSDLDSTVDSLLNKVQILRSQK